MFTDTLDLPAIWVPYAQPNNGQHGPNEHLQISHFMTGIEMAATALTVLGNTGP
jgi:acetylornithine deacetylase/succinyl-diaminopimelate desuccinylase-like protein